MEALLIHLLKSAGLLSIFYFGYQTLLRKETTFMKNRLFLAGGIIASLIMPAIYFTREVIIAAPTATAISLESFQETAIHPTEAMDFSWWELAGFLYLFITLFFLTRLCLHLFVILKMMSEQESMEAEGLHFFEIGQNTGAFSFFRNIFYNPHLHSQEELEIILQHEKVHALQLHSLDILLANICTSILWFNPLSWLYRKSVEQNLEYLADRETVNFTASKQVYQQTLLKASLPELQLSLTNNFYQSFIKKRIVMLNKHHSENRKFWKSSLVLPLIFAFMLAFNIKTEARIIQQQPSEAPVASKGISAHITRHTSKSELQEFEKEFADKNVKLDFTHVKHSSEGILTRIDISVRDKNTGNKGSLSRRNPNGIKPIDIFIDKNGQLSLGSAKKVKIEEISATAGKKKYRIIDQASILPKDEPLVILNGIPQKDRSKLDSLSPSEIEKIKVLKGTKATAIYGTRGSNGVIMVSTKSNNEQAPKIEIRKNITVIDSARNPNGDIYAYEHGKNHKEIMLRNPNSKRPLFVVDGEIQEKDFNLEEIDPEDIAAIHVLKGDHATEKYGKKGKNGVIQIHTKDAAPSMKKQMYLIKASYTDQQLEALKAEVLEKTGYDLQLQDIKRNEEGLITAIAVKFGGKGHMASANYATDGGIPDIHVGLKKNGGVILTSSSKSE